MHRIDGIRMVLRAWIPAFAGMTVGTGIQPGRDQSCQKKSRDSKEEKCEPLFRG